MALPWLSAHVIITLGRYSFINCFLNDFKNLKLFKINNFKLNDANFERLLFIHAILKKWFTMDDGVNSNHEKTVLDRLQDGLFILLKNDSNSVDYVDRLR